MGSERDRSAASDDVVLELCRLAQDFWPGSTASIASTGEAHPCVAAALAAKGPVWRAHDGGFSLGLVMRVGDDRAVMVVDGLSDEPQASDIERLARLGRLGGLCATREDAARADAIIEMVSSIPVAVMITDLEMRVIAGSPQFMSDVGVTTADYGNRSIFEIAPDQFLPHRPFYDRCLAGETFKTRKQLWRHPDGRLEWLRTELTPWRDATGAIGGLISVAIDITDMVEAMQSMEQPEQRLQIAVELADLHVWEQDLATGQMLAAGAAETFFDGSIDAKNMADTSQTIHPEDRALIGDEWREAVMANRPYRAEYRINRQDDREVWAQCQTKLIRNKAGKPVRLIGAMQNITARKVAEKALVHAKEEAEAANLAKSAFLATISHEIRTPLNGVLGMAQAMAADELNRRQRDRLETVRQSGETLLAILNDVLDLSKIEAGMLELELHDFELTPLISGVHAAFAAVAAQKSVAFDLEIDDEAKGEYRGDSTRLRQILFNLVSNALKFTERGEVRVRIGRQDDLLSITVCDTGIGIPEDRLPKLFNKFEQADASTTRRFGGSGLGLAICRDLVQMMGGSIDAKSREGHGSTFSVCVPLERLGEKRAHERRGAARAPTLEAETLHVLAAEDNPVNQMVLRTLLQQAGVEPFIVNDGAEALAAWQGGVWDVILMDVQMPVMDGPTAVAAIRAIERETGRARIPIIALTANAMAHQVDEYLAVGMDGVVSKPIRIEDLFSTLEKVLSESETGGLRPDAEAA